MNFAQDDSYGPEINFCPTTIPCSARLKRRHALVGHGKTSGIPQAGPCRKSQAHEKAFFLFCGRDCRFLGAGGGLSFVFVPPRRPPVLPFLTAPLGAPSRLFAFERGAQGGSPPATFQRNLRRKKKAQGILGLGTFPGTDWALRSHSCVALSSQP